MGEHHPLKPLLNICLASDASAVLHLPFVLNSLTPDSLAPSSHLPKWLARILALLHSKDAGGRWAGLVLAQKTATISQGLLLENGQAWVALALPLLSKNDSPVVLKAAIRLLRTIFGRSHEVPEFRRQVATPNIPKLLAALIPLIEQTGNEELKVMAVISLVNLVPLYPTLHKTAYNALSSFALRFLDGNPHAPASYEMLSAASRLYSTIHVTGGKVGASSLWRKALDETLAFGTNVFWSLRTTFRGQAPANVPLLANEDPVTYMPLQLDRLNCAVTILDDLLGAIVYRPVQLPLGAVVRFTMQLLRVTDGPKKEGFVDPNTHTLELSITPRIRALGCLLVVSLAERVDQHLQPYLTQILMTLAIQLEQRSTTEHRYVLLRALKTLLHHYPSSHSPLIATRLMKAVLPSVSKILASPEGTSDTGTTGSASAKGKKGRKKAQTYEGDELFSSALAVLCPTELDGNVLLTALEVVKLLLRDPHLSTTVQSVSIRALIAILMAIVRIPPASLSPDPSLHQDLLGKLNDISTDLASGTSSTLSKSLPLIVAALNREFIDVESQRQLDLLLHPRLPPLMRSIPLAENLALVFSEESEEEAELRKSLGLYAGHDELQQRTDVEMDDYPLLLPQPPEAPLPEPLPSFPTLLPELSESVQSTDNLRKGKKKAVEPPEVAAPKEQGPPPVRSSVIEAPKSRPSHLAAKSSQAEAPISKPPMYSAPAAQAEDEDEEIPAIDMDSDSELE